MIERSLPFFFVRFEDLTTLVPPRLTTDRIFSPDRRAVLFARVYQGGARPLLPVRIVTRIVNERDDAVFTAESTLEPAAFGVRRHADYRFELPLGRLATGDHLLSLEAGTATTSARRDLRFTVRR